MILLSLLLAAAPADGPQWNCEDPQAQQEMNHCAHQDYLKADAALNAQWKKAAAVMKQRDAGWDSDWDRRAAYFDTLLEAQRAWITYRDTHCTSEGYHFRGGSLERLLVAMCKTGLTEERTKQLRGLVELEK
jgi:uncharacterized protein YecT (DUF1311 family)